MIRRFLEWLYLFDFIEGDLAHAMFYYLHPKEFIDEILKIEAVGVVHAACPKCGKKLICNGGECDFETSPASKA